MPQLNVDNRRVTRWSLFGGLLLLLLAGGCRSALCQRMVECCRQVKDNHPEVGQSCGQLAEKEDDKATCRTVLKTVGYMFEDKDIDPPEACRLETSSSPSSKE